MTSVGRCLTAEGVKPVIPFKQAFENTYLYGCFSPITGDSFSWEVNGVDTIIFEHFLKAFSEENPSEYKIVVIDNAGFHSTRNITIPPNIGLLRIPPYSPELNPAEKVWQQMKKLFKNKVFETIKDVKKWIHTTVQDLFTKTDIKSIVHNEMYNQLFMDVFH